MNKYILFLSLFLFAVTSNTNAMEQERALVSPTAPDLTQFNNKFVVYTGYYGIQQGYDLFGDGTSIGFVRCGTRSASLHRLINKKGVNAFVQLSGLKIIREATDSDKALIRQLLLTGKAEFDYSFDLEREIESLLQGSKRE